MTIRLHLASLALFLVWFSPARAAEPAPKPPQIFFLIGEPEYDTKTTVPAFAKAELEPRGVRCTFSILPSDDSNDFPNFDALKDADLLFISVRRHTPSQAQMDAIRAFVAAGKAVVGIRTASHAFALRGKDAKPPTGYADWPEFDHEILGGNYHDHYGHGLETWAKIVPGQAQHPVLAGIAPEEFSVTSHLYKNPDLPGWVTPLLTARLAGRPEVEPIAWVSTKDHRRVFYTSLGAPEDFAPATISATSAQRDILGHGSCRARPGKSSHKSQRPSAIELWPSYLLVWNAIKWSAGSSAYCVTHR